MTFIRYLIYLYFKDLRGYKTCGDNSTNVLHSSKGRPSEARTIGGHDDFHTAQVIEAIELVQQLHP
jgi:hypothetical protein